MFDRIVNNFAQLTGVVSFLIAALACVHKDYLEAIWWLLVSAYLQHRGSTLCVPQANVEKNDPTYPR